MRPLLLTAALAALALPAHADVIFDSGGFDGYAAGQDIVGQNGWYEDANQLGPSDAYNPAIVVDTAPDGHGKAIQFNNLQGGGSPVSPTNQATPIGVAFDDLVAAGYQRADVQFDFYRDGNGASNLFEWQSPGNNPFYGYQTPDAQTPPRAIQPLGAFGSTEAITPNQWMTFLLQYDLTNGHANAFVNGVQTDTDVDFVGVPFDFAAYTFFDEVTGGAGQHAYLDNVRISAFPSTTPAVPEPSSLSLLGLALPLLGLSRRKR